MGFKWKEILGIASEKKDELKKQTEELKDAAEDLGDMLSSYSSVISVASSRPASRHRTRSAPARVSVLSQPISVISSMVSVAGSPLESHRAVILDFSEEDPEDRDQEWEIDIAAGTFREHDLVVDEAGNNFVVSHGTLVSADSKSRHRRRPKGKVVRVASAFPESEGLLKQLKNEETYSKLTMEKLERVVAETFSETEPKLPILTGPLGKEALHEAMREATNKLIGEMDPMKKIFVEAAKPVEIITASGIKVPISAMKDEALVDLYDFYNNEEKCYDIPSAERGECLVYIGLEMARRQLEKAKEEDVMAPHILKTTGIKMVESPLGHKYYTTKP